MRVTVGNGRPLPDLPPEVVERVLVELPGRGGKVVASLRTAAALIALAVSDDRGLRFADSAAYNLREALDAVVSGRSPVEGGLPAVLDAWGLGDHPILRLVPPLSRPLTSSGGVVVAALPIPHLPTGIAVDYCRHLVDRFDADPRVQFYVAPLGPFLDPGSRAYEHATQLGFQRRFTTLTEHRAALLGPPGRTCCPTKPTG